MSRSGGQRPSRPSRLASTAAAPPFEVTAEEALATELYALVRLALSRLGVNHDQQRRAQSKANRLAHPPCVSGPLMRNLRALADLLTEWARAPGYVDADGKPKVLRIAGSGASYATLAMRFLPQLTVSAAVSLACSAAPVAVRPSGKIALLGSPLVDPSGAPATALAHTIRHIDHLMTAVIHPARSNRRVACGPSPRLERLVVGAIPREAYPEVVAELRPQIHDLMERVDAAVQRRQPSARVAPSTSLSVGIYVSREDNWERAGLDPNLHASTRSPAP